MPSVHLRGLTFAHTSAAAVLTDVDLDLASRPGGRAFVGVVGANGAGKTTLLRLLVGELTPSSGALDVHSDLPALLVPQEVDGPSEAVVAFAATWDGVAASLRSRLDLDPDDLHCESGRSWAALSPGSRKRWQLATALAAQPDVLLLDEPTNHLDVAARELVLAELERFTGLGLVISHDRTVLERLTDRTLRLHAGGATLHAGSYVAASEQWRSEEAAAAAAHRKAVRNLRRERALLADLRRDRSSAEARMKRDRRVAGHTDPDAREAGRRAAQRKAEAELGARVRQGNTRVARAEDALTSSTVDPAPGAPLTFHHQASGRRTLLHLHGPVEHAGGEVWFEHVDLPLHRGERVHVLGTNGAGKTTLLAALLTTLADTEVAAALPQELTDPAAEVARVRTLDPTTRGQVLGAVAALGVDPDRVLVTDAPSPGEARKLALARLLVSDASVLVLDEPTNHLDLPSIERLGEALQAWPGALLLVTHDDLLAAASTTSRWHVRDQQVTVTDRGAAGQQP
jgi:ATPase subunit of ABC transporter with duplicated ATPase domains